ncbi:MULTISPECIES: hypothetical protein [unclassified Streptomyces]|uniref:hypothetical protein n=1 Tax=unclassified Streptomyces TaxID=2593676 RepID=UPI0018F67FC0|nr:MULTISPECIES: hypothetical protein [unclassified Streptomyces]
MPRGRHRHSPPLHRILPPSAVAGAAVLCAAGAWLPTEPMVLRALVAVAAAAAVTGAVLMRGWDREAGRRVAELTRARASDEWRAEERAAELESDLEEAREIRARLETKLRRKRVELAGLRSEHAALLRRYANAETERAGVLESRRQLAIEASAPARELPPARSTPTPEAFARAARALADLPRNAALQQARRAADEARRVAGEARNRQAEERSRPVPATRPVPAASAVVPYAGPRRGAVPQGGFDFFGTQKEAPPTVEPAAERAAIESVQDEDLADVVGEEALAAHRSDTARERAVGKVIDLTAHDETEQLDVAELRSAIS